MKILILLTVFLFTDFTFAQSFTIPIWGKVIPNRIETDEVETTEFAENSNILLIKNVQVPTIEVFLPKNENLNKKAVIICPGGGYQVLAYNWEGTEIAKWLNENGIVGIVLKYRLPTSKSVENKQFTPFFDLQRAIKLVRFNSKNWGIDEDKIGIMGFSAGGHLAATFGTHFGTSSFQNTDEIDLVSETPNFLVLAYPVISFQDSITHSGSKSALLGENPDSNDVYFFSNEFFVSQNTPPTFIFHAQDDNLVSIKNSELFYRKLEKYNSKSEFVIFPKGGHGFSLAKNDKLLHSWTDKLILWLENLK